MENTKFWYAVLVDEDDNDWGTGSYDLRDAIKMAEKYGEEAYIAVIEEGELDNVCVDEIRRDEDGDWVSSVR